MIMGMSMASVSARNVTVNEAKDAAARYMAWNASLPYLTASDVELIYQIDNEQLGVPAVYFFNVGRSGWVILGANTAANGVLAYSECGRIVVDEMPEAMLLLLDDHATIIKAVQEADEEGKFNDSEEWIELLGNNERHPTKDVEHILMDEEWNQEGESENFSNGTTYDMLTPSINGKHAPVGCVATALAQICHYYKFPVKPRGSASYRTSTEKLQLSVSYDTVTFDYSNMPNKIVASTPTDQRYEVSELGYMIGLAVNMDYTVDASGTSSEVVPTKMVTNFKYKRGSITYRRSSYTGNYARYLDYSPYNRAVDDSVFFQRLRDELSNNRPVYIDGVSSVGSGRDAGGHAWVCCGYRDTNENMYYMNWGWGGRYNSWFNLNTNNLYIRQQGLNLKLCQSIITGLVPPADSTDININVGIGNVADNVLLPAAYPNPAVSSVNLPYSLPADGDMVIYGVDGREVDRIRLHAGNGIVEVRVSEMPSGIYLYRLNGATGKFVVQ